VIGALYFEAAVAGHPRTRELRKRFARLPQIEIERYGELFNRTSQNFRLQKSRPSLILAEKREGWVLPAPEICGVGEEAFYFSHLLNCPYDCRYCFLQGMYRSANYVLFVNYEDFFAAIEKKLAERPGSRMTFYSGYDCDSLALEGLTGFAAAALPFFRRQENAVLELRTKAVASRALQGEEPWPGALVAASLTPPAVAEVFDHGAPPVGKRIEGLAQLAAKGWPIGLRFDPLIFSDDFAALYGGLFEQVFAALPASAVASVGLGPFRLPSPFYRKLEKLYPDDRALMSAPLEERGGTVSYSAKREQAMVDFCVAQLSRYLPPRMIEGLQIGSGGMAA
jgi:spore photoproduct lyase